MFKLIKVYLSGPMYLGKEQATKWRDEVKEILLSCNCNEPTYKIYDPCIRFFDDKNFLGQNGSWIVKIDKMEIADSDVVIVNATEPGWGTPMEQYIAYSTGKFVIAFDDKDHASIWTKAHCHVYVESPRLAAKWLCEHSDQLILSGEA